MMKDAPFAQWKYIIVYDFSRFARSVQDTLYYSKQLNQHGIKIISVLEDTNDTSEGQFFNLIQMGLAEMYSQNPARSTFLGVIAAAKQGKGKIMGGTVNFGYDIFNNEYVVNLKEAKPIQLMFDLILEGKSYQETARILNVKGYVTKKVINLHLI